MLGLAQVIITKYSDDTTLVFELEHQDNQDDSESDADEEIIDLDFPTKQMLLTNNLSSKYRFNISTNLNLEIEIIGVSQPTPPPQYIG